MNYGRTFAMVTRLKADPKAACLVPNQARKDWLVQTLGVNPDQVLVPATEPLKGTAYYWFDERPSVSHDA